MSSILLSLHQVYPSFTWKCFHINSSAPTFWIPFQPIKDTFLSGSFTAFVTLKQRSKNGSARSNHAFLLLVTSLSFFLGSEAYTIDSSCKPYEVDYIDKTGMIQSAMIDAGRMMDDAGNTIVNKNTWKELFDNSRDICFPGASDADLIEIQGVPGIP